jgi:hypothetical protein
MRANCLVPLLLCVVEGQAEAPPDPALIMAQVARNVEEATDSRRHYVYRQKVRSSLIKSNNQIARKEAREYSVIPGVKGTEKKLESFQGEYRKGKEMIAYTEPGFTYKGLDIDGEIIDELTEDLVNDKDSRDGIPHSLFPLRTKDLSSYRFTLRGESHHKGRPLYVIGFEPRKKSACVEAGGDCDGEPWKGEAWIDKEDLQPVRIATDLAFKIPWAVRVFLGTNLRQTGFSITYRRVAENVWFPETYGTEFRLDALWFYKRTITLSMESEGFQKTDAVSKIEYNLPEL